MSETRTAELQSRQADALQAIIDVLPNGIALFDPSMRLISCNEPFKRLLGLPPAAFEGSPPTMHELALIEESRSDLGPGAHETLAQQVAERGRSMQPRVFERTRPDGATLEVRFAPLPGDRGLAVICTDITERMRAAEKTHEGEALFRLLTEDVRDVVWKLDRDFRFTYISPADERQRGFRADEVIGHHVLEMFDHEGAGIVAEIMRQRQIAERNGTPRGAITFEVQHRCKDGRLLWGEIFSTPERNEHGAITGYHGITREITERKRMEEQIRRLAFYDTLTNLPNRCLLNDRMGQAMVASKRNGRYGALMFIDLDNFKKLNDTHGHDVGDLLLIEAADRLKKCVRGTDTVSRLGGDEFVVMLCDLNVDKVEATAQAKIVAAKIRDMLSEPYLMTTKRVGTTDTVVRHDCTASIGVALFIDCDESPDNIFKWADAAMYEAKANGGNTVRFYGGVP